jgi:alginate O-acetyltransferase complex protein AlgI
VGLQLHQTTADRTRRHWLWLSMTVNLGMLGIFKYFNFFADSAVQFSNLLGFSLDPVTLQIVLPVGISFYTFQTMSYTIDIYRRQLEPTRSLPDFALFVAFFPQLVAGPIVRAKDFLYQLDTTHKFSSIDFRWALMLFLIGFIKKAGVADNIALIIDPFYLNPANFGTVSSWIAISAYAAQIYCDFSAYSDMAIAIAGMFGYKLRENFNSPYIATTLADFWRRWHMSLSTWMRDYLYYSLPGSKRVGTRAHVNMMITMLLGGLWHGAALNFVLWGGMHGLGLMVYQIYRRRFKKFPALPDAVGMFLTVLFVVLSVVLFRATSLSNSLEIWTQLFSWSTDQSVSLLSLNQHWLLWALPALWVVHYLHGKQLIVPVWRGVSPVVFAFGYGVAWAIALATQATQFTPFIYFQF